MKHIEKIFSIGLIILILSSCAVTKEYERAVSTNSITAYENYQNEFPKSKYKADVEKRLAVLYEEQAWKNAKNETTIESYNSFIDLYPSSKYAYDAKSKIRKLKEENAWKIAYDENTINSYSDYLKRYPYGKYSSSASNKIEKLKEEKYVLPVWNETKIKNTYKAYSEFLNKYPNSSYAYLAKDQMITIEKNDWNKACRINTIKSFKGYNNKYPNGEYVETSQKKIIDLEVDNIFKGDYGKLPPMSKTSHGYSYSSTNTIEIYNNTKYTLTVRYSGDDSKKIVLSPRLRTSMTLKNGKYRVAASVNAANVQNYAGNENLTGGEYSSEFYIKTQTYKTWGY